MLYKTVKVPLWVYEDALDARADVLRQGLQFLPKEILEPANCPRCGGDLEVLTAGYQRLECTSCGFKQEKIAVSGTSVSGIGLGLFYPLVAKSISQPKPLGPYSVGVCFGMTKNTSDIGPQRQGCSFLGRHLTLSSLRSG